MSKTYHLRTRIELPLARDRIFAFFCDAANLERITPRELGFAIATKLPIEMREGTLIDYTIKVWGVPLKWRTRIARWSPPDVFVDEQLKGPYKKWIHTHRFLDAANGGTIIEDHVEYALPFGMLGRVVAPVIRLQLNRIFRFREASVRAALLSA